MINCVHLGYEFQPFIAFIRNSGSLITRENNFIHWSPGVRVTTTRVSACQNNNMYGCSRS